MFNTFIMKVKYKKIKEQMQKERLIGVLEWLKSEIGGKHCIDLNILLLRTKLLSGPVKENLEMGKTDLHQISGFLIRKALNVIQKHSMLLLGGQLCQKCIKLVAPLLLQSMVLGSLFIRYPIEKFIFINLGSALFTHSVDVGIMRNPQQPGFNLAHFQILKLLARPAKGLLRQILGLVVVMTQII